MTHRSVRGFTLLELLITAGIGMLIIASAYAVFRAREADVQVREAAALVGFMNKTADQITSLSASYQVPRSGAATNVTMQDLITGFAAANDALPFGSSTSANQIFGPFGAVTTSVMSSSAGANDLFTITMPNVPTKSCAQILNRALSFSSIYDMSVNNALVPLWPAPTKDAAGNVVARGRSGTRVDLTAPLCAKASYVTLQFRKLKDINFSDLRRQQLGSVMSASESAVVTPLYNRQVAAMNAREAAQAAF